MKTKKNTGMHSIEEMDKGITEFIGKVLKLASILQINSKEKNVKEIKKSH